MPDSVGFVGIEERNLRKGIIAAFFMALSLPMFPMRVQAAQEGLLPHLIQTVSEQDIYESMIALGMLESDVLENEDCESAYENVKSCVVRVDMGNAYGSGIVWKLTPDHVIIATNSHVLDYWENMTSFVYFEQGHFANAEIIGTSERHDVGFLKIDNSNFTYEQLKELRCVRYDMEIYSGLEKGDGMFVAGAGVGIGELEFYEGTVEDTRRYIALFEDEMLYGYGIAKAGMSGGGAFDGKGYFIGMLSGGTDEYETASVPVGDIEEAYQEIVTNGGI